MEQIYKDQYTRYQTAIESYLDSVCFQYDSEPQQTLFHAMRYSLLAGGKRLRPIFVFDFCRMVGGDWQTSLPFAAAVEMIHTYSLIHDDLPCMDNDDYRRGMLTNHKVFGEAMAILSGDALLTSAFSYLANAPFCADTRIRAVTVLSECSGELGMVGGQVLDIQSEQRQCTEQEVLDIQSRKTGALIKAACLLGVLAGNGTQEQIHAAARFAHHLGQAFQIRDDILSEIGNAEELGKPVGNDKQRGKCTYVTKYGLEESKKMLDNLIEEAINIIDKYNKNDFLKSLALYISNRNK